MIFTKKKQKLRHKVRMFVSSLEWQSCVEHHYAIDWQKQLISSSLMNNPLRTAEVDVQARTFPAKTFQPTKLESCSNPPKMRKVF